MILIHVSTVAHLQPVAIANHQPIINGITMSSTIFVHHCTYSNHWEQRNAAVGPGSWQWGTGEWCHWRLPWHYSLPYEPFLAVLSYVNHRYHHQCEWPLCLLNKAKIPQRSEISSMFQSESITLFITCLQDHGLCDLQSIWAFPTGIWKYRKGEGNINISGGAVSCISQTSIICRKTNMLQPRQNMYDLVPWFLIRYNEYCTHFTLPHINVQL